MLDLKEYKLLVVDDSPSWQDHLSQLLDDFDVITVGSKEAALKTLLLRDSPPAVAIVDKSLKPNDGEDESGLALAEEIKARIPNCQIVILTGFEDYSSMRRAFKHIEVYDYLQKNPDDGSGFDNQRLRETVLRALLDTGKLAFADAKDAAYRPKPESVTILHLSDLHFGSKHRFLSDRRLPRREAPTLAGALTRYLDDISKRPDIIVVSGDLAETGDWREFNQARHFLDELREHFKAELPKVVVVPGNHDVRWIVDDNVTHEKVDGLLEYRSFYEFLYGVKPPEGDPLFRVEMCEFDNKPDVFVVGLDSCVIEGPNTAGMGYVGRTQLTRMVNDLEKSTGGKKGVIKIAVLHHHLLPVTFVEKMPQERRSVSLVLDATAVLAELQKQGFSLVLHGHQHQPFCAQVKFPTFNNPPEMPLTIVGIGSAGIRPEPELVGGSRNNHFGILEIHKMLPHSQARATISWHRASSNEPEETFELDREFVLTI